MKIKEAMELIEAQQLEIDKLNAEIDRYTNLCPTCGGDGYTEEYEEYCDELDDYNEVCRHIDCPTCKGSGRVPKSITEVQE